MGSIPTVRTTTPLLSRCGCATARWQLWPGRLSVRTSGSQPGKRGSIPRRAAILYAPIAQRIERMATDHKTQVEFLVGVPCADAEELPLMSRTSDCMGFKSPPVHHRSRSGIRVDSKSARAEFDSRAACQFCGDKHRALLGLITQGRMAQLVRFQSSATNAQHLG